MRFLTHVITLLLLAASAQAQTLSQATLEVDSTTSWTVGAELDAFPFATGGWYGSVFVGLGTVRIRGVAAESFLPSFVRAEGITEERVRTYAGILDFTFGPNFDQWWLGFGYEHWTTNYTSADGTAETSTNVLTVGGGYIWKFWKGFYLNPWVAAHVLVDRPFSVAVGSTTVNPPNVLPSISIKLGWNL